MKYMDELAALPVRYFCNYSLLGGVGIIFELLVFGIRSGWDIAPGWQSMAVAAMLVTILQTAAEYFIPSENTSFLLRLSAALAHVILFSALILMQISVDMPAMTVCGLLGILFWALIFCQICFRGKGSFLILPLLFFSIILLLPALAGGQTWVLAPSKLIVGNILLFLFACSAWHGRNRKATKKEQPL